MRLITLLSRSCCYRASGFWYTQTVDSNAAGTNQKYWTSLKFPMFLTTFALKFHIFNFILTLFHQIFDPFSHLIEFH